MKEKVTNYDYRVKGISKVVFSFSISWEVFSFSSPLLLDDLWNVENVARYTNHKAKKTVFRTI
jgi:hypothetical protein